MSRKSAAIKLPPQYRKVGRSVEEIMLRRKLDGKDPNSWPELSSSGPLPGYANQILTPIPNAARVESKTEKTNANEMEKTGNEKESSAIISSLTDYCKKLQGKIKDLEYKLKESQLMMEITKESNNAVNGLRSAGALVHDGYFTPDAFTPAGPPRVGLDGPRGPSSRGGRRDKNGSPTRPGSRARSAGRAQSMSPSRFQSMTVSTAAKARSPSPSRAQTPLDASRKRAELALSVDTEDGNNNTARRETRFEEPLRSNPHSRPISRESSFHDGTASIGSGSTSTFPQRVRGMTRQQQGYRDRPADISKSVVEIDSKLRSLKMLFQSKDPLEIRRLAATKIASRIRGFIARARYVRFMRSLNEWKWSRCRHVIFCLDIMLSSQTDKEAGMQQLRMVRESRRVKEIFDKWSTYAFQTRDIRNKIKRNAEELIGKHDRFVKRLAFDSLRKLLGGKRSKKWASRQRRELTQRLRAEISERQIAQGLPGVVLEEDVQNLLRRHIIADFYRDLQRKNMRIVFDTMAEEVRRMKKLDKDARQYWYRRHAGKVFYAWAEWNYMVGAGLDRQRWKGPAKYDVRYNQKRVDYFARMRQIRYVFYPWLEYHKLAHKVKLKRVFKSTKFLRQHFAALREVAHRQRQLRKAAIQSWKEYAPLMLTKPFKSWVKFLRMVRSEAAEKEHLSNTYRRWKTRKFLILIMRTWRHQALYGRTDGMYTRKMLVSSLHEQKQTSARLEKLMVSQTVELEECRDLVAKEIHKRKTLESKLQIANQEIHRNRMLVHHAEQEVRRMEAIVDAMAIINPRQVDHLRRLQPSFKFKDRNLALIAAAAGVATTQAEKINPANAAAAAAFGIGISTQGTFGLSDAMNFDAAAAFTAGGESSLLAPSRKPSFTASARGSFLAGGATNINGRTSFSSKENGSASGSYDGGDSSPMSAKGSRKRATMAKSNLMPIVDDSSTEGSIVGNAGGELHKALAAARKAVEDVTVPSGHSEKAATAAPEVKKPTNPVDAPPTRSRPGSPPPPRRNSRELIAFPAAAAAAAASLPRRNSQVQAHPLSLEAPKPETSSASPPSAFASAASKKHLHINEALGLPPDMPAVALFAAELTPTDISDLAAFHDLCVITQEEQRLLDRAKWLVSRYKKDHPATFVEDPVAAEIIAFRRSIASPRGAAADESVMDDSLQENSTSTLGPAAAAPGASSVSARDRKASTVSATAASSKTPRATGPVSSRGDNKDGASAPAGAGGGAPGTTSNATGQPTADGQTPGATPAPPAPKTVETPTSKAIQEALTTLPLGAGLHHDDKSYTELVPQIRPHVLPSLDDSPQKQREKVLEASGLSTTALNFEEETNLQALTLALDGHSMLDSPSYVMQQELIKEQNAIFNGGDAESGAARMLLSFLDFLEEGDVTLLAPDDKRDWTRTVLESVQVQIGEDDARDKRNEDRHDAIEKYLDDKHRKEEREKRRIEDERRMAALEAAGDFNGKIKLEKERRLLEETLRKEEEEKALRDRDAEAKRRKEEEETEKEKAKAKEAAKHHLNEALQVMGDFSWRTAVMYLRALHPNGGNLSGVGAPLDQDSRTGMYTRILDMRESLVGVMRRKKARADRRQLLIRALQEIDSDDNSISSTAKKNTGKLRAIQKQLEEAGALDASDDDDDVEQGDYGDLNIYADNLHIRLQREDHHLSADAAYVEDGEEEENESDDSDDEHD